MKFGIGDKVKIDLNKSMGEISCQITRNPLSPWNLLGHMVWLDVTEETACGWMGRIPRNPLIMYIIEPPAIHFHTTQVVEVEHGPWYVKMLHRIVRGII